MSLCGCLVFAPDDLPQVFFGEISWNCFSDHRRRLEEDVLLRVWRVLKHILPHSYALHPLRISSCVLSSFCPKWAPIKSLITLSAVSRCRRTSEPLVPQTARSCTYMCGRGQMEQADKHLHCCDELALFVPEEEQSVGCYSYYSDDYFSLTCFQL